MRVCLYSIQNTFGTKYFLLNSFNNKFFEYHSMNSTDYYNLLERMLLIKNNVFVLYTAIIT